VEIIKGRCLCGAVTFEFDGPVNWSGHCHCESCRRTTSSAFTTFIGVPRKVCRFTGAAPQAYGSSPGVRRLFCGRCGSPIAYDAEAYPDEIHLYLASLEDPNAITPSSHAFYEEKLSWLEVDDGLPVYEETPED
jgi:hypothetical protein